MHNALTTLLAQIREADEKATGSQWANDLNGFVRAIYGDDREWGSTVAAVTLEGKPTKQDNADCDLIALYRTVTPLLAKMLEEAVEALEMADRLADTNYYSERLGKLDALAAEAISQQQR
jgi:hypothetical protein